VRYLDKSHEFVAKKISHTAPVPNAAMPVAHSLTQTVTIAVSSKRRLISFSVVPRVWACGFLPFRYELSAERCYQAAGRRVSGFKTVP
jgi:hypothetical protein